jgi:hypothetical protein
MGKKAKVNKNPGRQYRQGDVLITEVDAFPDGLTPLAPGTITLAEGEQTGHSHTIGGVAVAGQDTFGSIYFDVENAESVVHQEHDPIDLAPQRHRSERQRVYTPEAIRSVAD